MKKNLLGKKYYFTNYLVFVLGSICLYKNFGLVLSLSQTHKMMIFRNKIYQIWTALAKLAFDR